MDNRVGSIMRRGLGLRLVIYLSVVFPELRDVVVVL